ncbi:MAG TPA: DUF1501 domain-containing protein [Gammaproteobacteria bacterium]|nr:DUF1501 domain-containing protein [Gammaproteobacteria bacterium]
MERRRILQLLAAAPALRVSGRLYAAPSSSPRFLLVFLRGGYDSLNVLVPYSSADYYEARPTIAVAKPDPADADSAVALDADWGLAPALRESILPLYERGEAAFVPFAGTDDTSRSHFETQDSIELGEPLAGPRSLRSGFMARLAAELEDPRPIAFTDSLPLTFRGEADIPNVSLKGAGKPVFDERQAGILARMYTGHPLEAAVRDGLDLREEVGAAIAEEMAAANRDAVTPQGFELEAQRIALLMRDQYRLGFIDVGGWDTHVNEGNGKGQLANGLRSLGRGLAVLSQGRGAEWKNTVVFVVSEFGRTFAENGNRGTDHGHGCVYWVLGGGIDGKRIAGEQCKIARAELFEHRDLPVLNDYRALLGGMFARMWGLSEGRLAAVFPAASPVDLGLV